MPNTHTHLSVGNIYGSRSLTNARGGQTPKKEERVYGIIWIGYNLKKKKAAWAVSSLRRFSLSLSVSEFFHVYVCFSFWLSLCCARFDNTLW